jgi:hypothetical protein
MAEVDIAGSLNGVTAAANSIAIIKQRRERRSAANPLPARAGERQERYRKVNAPVKVSH